ncbi:MAG TPA: hypothetical protein VIJ15_12465 [Dermatophilaceae bacterium]
MSAIDNEILAMFDELNPTRQGQLLDLLGKLIAEQHDERPQNQPSPQRGQEPAHH